MKIRARNQGDLALLDCCCAPKSKGKWDLQKCTPATVSARLRLRKTKDTDDQIRHTEENQNKTRNLTSAVLTHVPSPLNSPHFLQLFGRLL